jgi:hypothetical protein
MSTLVVDVATGTEAKGPAGAASRLCRHAGDRRQRGYMNEKESHGAARESLREVVDHLERPPAHEEALARYLSGIAYEESHHRRPVAVAATRHADENPQD